MVPFADIDHLGDVFGDLLDIKPFVFFTAFKAGVDGTFPWIGGRITRNYF